MFQFPGFPPASLCVQPAGDRGSRGRVSPFGYHRISACTRLPDAFRSVPRPSSALDAQASPVRLLALVSSFGDRTPSFFDAHYTYSVVKVLVARDCVSRLRQFAEQTAWRLAVGCWLTANCQSLIANMGLTRLELVTFPLSEGCSNRLSYRPPSRCGRYKTPCGVSWRKPFGVFALEKPRNGFSQAKAQRAFRTCRLTTGQSTR
jgi:hypothetical protein